MELPVESPLRNLSSELRLSVRQVQVDLLWRNSPAGYVANVFVALVIMLTLSNTLGIAVKIWFATVLAVTFARAALTLVYIRARRQSADPDFWGVLFIALTFMTGSTWGVLGGFLFPHADPYGQSLIIVVVVGITAGAVVTNGFIATAYYVYLGTAMAPYIVRTLSGDQRFDLPLGAMAVIYSMFMVVAARRTNENLVNNLVSIHQLEQATRELIRAQHDQLTGLPTRGLLYDRLQQAMLHAERHQKLLAVLFMDLDGFKQVNDTYGHDAGDEALRLLALRLKESVRAEDTVARHGGDEFVLVLGDLNDFGEVEPIVHKLLAQITALQISGDRRCKLTASFGVAFYPGEGKTGAELISLADAAMYRAKQDGKNTFAMNTRLTPPSGARADAQ